jgi:Zn-dependent protease
MNAILITGIAAVVIPSITSHEAAHGFVADRLGDPTARSLGRLTLNPIPHIDLFFTVLMPGLLLLLGSPILIGGAKPVPVNVAKLRKPRRDWAIVGAAGPLTNLLIAGFFSLLVAILSFWIGLSANAAAIEILSVGIYFNVLLFVFNIIPIPPLDGSRIVQYFLSDEALVTYQRIEKYGLLLIIALVLLFPPMQLFLVDALREITFAVTAPFGTTAVVDAGLQGLLGGSFGS